MTGPANDQRNSNSTFVELALAATERCIRRNVCFTTVVTRKNEDGVLCKAEFVQFFRQQANSLIDTFQHRG